MACAPLCALSAGVVGRGGFVDVIICSECSLVVSPRCVAFLCDLQDHKGGGIVHFRTRDDMEYALRKLDGSDFRNPFEKSRISVSRVWVRVLVVGYYLLSLLLLLLLLYSL